MDYLRRKIILLVGLLAIIALPLTTEVTIIANDHGPEFFPSIYKVSMSANVSDDGWRKKQRFCSGALISDQWILTAAHCFTDIEDPTKWKVKLQTWRSLVVARAKTLIIHPSYQYQYPANGNIALLKLNKRVKLDSGEASQTPSIRTVRLPEQSEMDSFADREMLLTIGRDCTIKGRRIRKPNHSMYVYLWKTSDKICGNLYGRKKIEKVICAGGAKYGGVKCSGDIGVPLLKGKRYGKKYEKILVGILSSFGSTGDKPTGFTRVSSYVNWIKLELCKDRII